MRTKQQRLRVWLGFVWLSAVSVCWTGCFSYRRSGLEGRSLLLAGAHSPVLRKELHQEARHLRGTKPIEARELCALPNVAVQLVRIVGAEQPHRHLDHDLVVFLVEGRGSMFLGHDTHAIEAGDIVAIEKGTEHAFRNAARGGTVAVVVRVPPASSPEGAVR